MFTTTTTANFFNSTSQHYVVDQFRVWYTYTTASASVARWRNATQKLYMVLYIDDSKCPLHTPQSRCTTKRGRVHGARLRRIRITSRYYIMFVLWLWIVVFFVRSFRFGWLSHSLAKYWAVCTMCSVVLHARNFQISIFGVLAGLGWVVHYVCASERFETHDLRSHFKFNRILSLSLSIRVSHRIVRLGFISLELRTINRPRFMQSTIDQNSEKHFVAEKRNGPQTVTTNSCRRFVNKKKLNWIDRDTDTMKRRMRQIMFEQLIIVLLSAVGMYELIPHAN